MKKHASDTDKENVKNRMPLEIHSQAEDMKSAGSGVIDTDRKLGTLQVKRTSKTDAKVPRTRRVSVSSTDTEGDSMSSKSSVQSQTDTSEFDSNYSVRNYPIEVSDKLIERCATQLSTNDMVVGRTRSIGDNPGSIGTARMLAQDKSKHLLMESTIRLLLHRGADPNASSVPMPVLFFATKAADVEAVRLLLLKGASTATKLPKEKGGLTPLHIAAAIPGEEGVKITQLLLDSLANPDERATEDDSFLNISLQDEWKKDVIDKPCQQLLGGRTPLHIACARDDNYKNACKVVHLLLSHHANSKLLCNGQSPLTLAIQSGNDQAVEELLGHGVDASQRLSHGVGSALCVASSTEFEHRRTPEARIRLIDKLMRGRADILAPVAIGNKRVRGTCVDYAYHMYNLDRRIAHMPYHALSPAERETFNARRGLLSHLGELLRISAVAKEKERMHEERQQGRMSRSPSPSFRYTGAGAPLPPGTKRKGKLMDSSNNMTFGDDLNQSVRKPLLRYCYECGRSVGVKLLPCTRCKEVFYCSKACKLKAWNARHKDECVRLGGRSASPRSKKDRRIDSPTPACDPDKGNPTTVSGIIAQDARIKLFLDLLELYSSYEEEFPIISDANSMFLNGDLPPELARLQAYSEVQTEEVPPTFDHDVVETIEPEGRLKGWIPKMLIDTSSVECNDSGIELQTLDYENPGSNPVLRC
ncbi:hypothetical protein NP493_1089g00009 [Ridgeia piscesae]|uniref:MYND-type domain-containing protein n=1 Tax=Ridgeia piscesae TaxID=27915 RepID=A0AAD9NJU6_RIDPI|nr:hypothetical protein NP493_1089g00009 [Ridgeia piscesae]